MFIAVSATALRTLTNLLLLPIVLTRLSDVELALWWLFLSLGAMLSLADFGFSSAMGRVYSFLWAGAEDFEVTGFNAKPPPGSVPNRTRITDVTAAVGSFYHRIGWIGGLLLAVGGTPFLFRYLQQTTNPTLILVAWGLFVAISAYGLSTSYWSVACQGIDRVWEMHLAVLVGSVAYFFVAALGLWLGGGLLSLALATSARALIARQISIRTVLSQIPEIRSRKVAPDPVILRKLWPNAWKFGLTALSAYLISNLNVIVSSQFLPANVTASLGLTQQFTTLLATVSMLWLSTQWPAITIMRTQGREEEMAILFARRLTRVMLTYAVGAVGLIFCGELLLKIKQTSTHLLPMVPLTAYLIYLGWQVFYGAFGNLVFTENHNPFYRAAVATGVGCALLLLILTPSMGLWGLLLAPMISELAYNAWAIPLRGFRGQPLGLRAFLAQSAKCFLS